MLTLFFSLILSGQAFIEHTGVYDAFDLVSRLGPQIVVSEKGDVFFINMKTSKIKHFSADGKPMPDFGGKGQGPGEFSNFPSHLAISGDKLYAIEPFSKMIHCFSTGGTFLKQIPISHFGAWPSKVQGGWVYVEDHKFQDKSSETKELMWVDENFENPVILHSWPKEKETKGFNPAPERDFLGISEDLGRIFLYRADRHSILTFDAKTKKEVSSFKLEITRVAFDEDFGERQTIRQSRRSSRRGVKLEPDYPEFFPMISSMRVLDNQIWVYPGNSMANPDVLPISFDFSGKKASPKLEPEIVSNTIGVCGGWAFVMKSAEYDDLKIERVKINP